MVRTPFFAVIATGLILGAWPPPADAQSAGSRARWRRHVEQLERELAALVDKKKAKEADLAKAKADAQATVKPYNEAQAAYEKAKDAHKAAKDKETKTLEALNAGSPLNPKIDAAKENAKTNLAKRQAMKTQVQDELAGRDASYKALRAELERLKKELETLKAQPGYSRTKATQLTTRILELGSKVAKLESAALAKSPEYGRLLEAAKANHKEMSDLLKQRTESISADPKRLAAADSTAAAFDDFKEKLAVFNAARSEKAKAAAAYKGIAKEIDRLETLVRRARYKLSGARRSPPRN